MNKSLKLSYEMLFENAAGLDNSASVTEEEPPVITPEELEQALQKQNEHWQKRLEKERKAARKEGFNKGFAKGKAKAEQSFAEQLSGLNKITKAIDRELKQALDELIPQLAQLVFDITEKVLDIPFQHDELQQNVKLEITHLIDNLDEELHIKMQVTQTDLEMIQQALKQDKPWDRVTLRQNEDLKPGEYVLETSKECIIKNFKKIVADFKETISFGDIENPVTG